MLTTVTIPMRLSLFGGGSDLYRNGRVISAAISKKLHVVHLPRDYGYHLAYSRVESASTIDQIQNSVIREALKALNAPPCEIHVLSELPDSAGLGGSSALTTALVSALRPTLGPYDCAAFAFDIESRTKTLGWQDHFGTALGGTKCLLADEHSLPIVLPLTDAPWDEFINRYVQLWKAPPRKLDAEAVLSTYTEDTFALAASVSQALNIGPYDVHRLGELLTKTWEAKRKLSPQVSTLEIDRKIDFLLEQGAVGAKLCGAGGGGFIMTIAPKRLHLSHDEVKFTVSPTGLVRK